jgi:hypothetical protein
VTAVNNGGGRRLQARLGGSLQWGRSRAGGKQQQHYASNREDNVVIGGGFDYLSRHSWPSPPIFLPIAVFLSLFLAILGFSFRALRKKASFALKSLSRQKFNSN